MKKFFDKERIPGLSVIVVCSLIVLFLGSYGAGGILSSYYEYETRSHLDAWSEANTVPSLDDWQTAKSTLEEALHWNGRRPELYQLAGLLQEWRGFSIAGENPDANELLLSRREAVVAYREYTELLPANPTAWSHLARLKLLSGETGEEFKNALLNAIRYGRHFPASQYEVSYVIAADWNSVKQDPVFMAEAISSLDNSLRDQMSNQVLGNLQQFNVLDEICPLLDSEGLPQQVNRACQDVSQQ